MTVIGKREPVARIILNFLYLPDGSFRAMKFKTQTVCQLSV